jgi:hypothetical protein
MIEKLINEAFQCYLETKNKNKIEEQKPMKKYRCKIDSPFGKSGEVCKLEGLYGEDAIGRFFLSIDPSQYPDLFEEVTKEKWERENSFNTILPTQPAVIVGAFINQEFDNIYEKLNELKGRL